MREQPETEVFWVSTWKIKLSLITPDAHLLMIFLFSFAGEFY